jgi:RimJ/RimL family protein N-acetyltransferase
VIAAAEDCSAVGFLQVTEINLIDGHGTLGIAIHPGHARRGHARAAVRLVGPYLRDVFGLRKLILEVRSDNTAALALYRSLGFREVGVWREHHRIGDRYLDVVGMESSLVL